MHLLRRFSKLFALFALPCLLCVIAYNISREGTFFKLAAALSFLFLTVLAFWFWTKDREAEAATLLFGTLSTTIAVIFSTGYWWEEPITLPGSTYKAMVACSMCAYGLLFISHIPLAWHKKTVTNYAP